MLDVDKIKEDFPILKRKVNGKDLVYLDNSASSQKPKQVVDALSDYYLNHHANVHRGVHTLSEEASELYENARKNVSDFIGATRPKELIFTSGTTQSLNMVAFGWGLKNLKKDDIILISDVEHHSNLVPWQIVAEKTGAKLVHFSLLENENKAIVPKLRELIDDRVKIITITHSSNVTGAITPIKDITREARKVGALVCIDGAQSAPHFEVNVKSLGVDFYSFSAHKMLGPTGIGALWVKQEVMGSMEPMLFGGGMIKAVYENSAEWADLPEKFEAGTPNIAGAVGFSAAINYLRALGMENVRQHEVDLNNYALEKLLKIDKLNIIGPRDPEARTGLVSFTVGDYHAHDISTILNTEGVAVRSGHHCAMPLHIKLDIPASTRASYYIYNTKSDIDSLVAGIKKAVKILNP